MQKLLVVAALSSLIFLTVSGMPLPDNADMTVSAEGEANVQSNANWGNFDDQNEGQQPAGDNSYYGYDDNGQQQGQYDQGNYQNSQQPNGNADNGYNWWNNYDDQNQYEPRNVLGTVGGDSTQGDSNGAMNNNGASSNVLGGQVSGYVREPIDDYDYDWWMRYFQNGHQQGNGDQTTSDDMM